MDKNTHENKQKNKNYVVFCFIIKPLTTQKRKTSLFLDFCPEKLKGKNNKHQLADALK